MRLKKLFEMGFGFLGFFKDSKFPLHLNSTSKQSLTVLKNGPKRYVDYFFRFKYSPEMHNFWSGGQKLREVQFFFSQNRIYHKKCLRSYNSKHVAVCSLLKKCVTGPWAFCFYWVSTNWDWHKNVAFGRKITKLEFSSKKACFSHQE